ncbi:MAG TPA: beta-ketoacyl synthase chain length factor [Puia sp.]|nr:beta-ketoacyl synthase chain length factor [Puia sp.]
MFYIHQATCISPQQTFSGTKIDLSREYESVDNRMKVLEPPYPDIPDNILRRMAKAVRMGVGTAIPLIQGAGDHPPAGIIIGTANGGMEESVKFLKQIIEYKEDMLTPGNFVQSIPNAISSQISLLSKNKGYNTTHVHRGLAFENAVLDAAMLLKENPRSSYLVGGVDEIATYHHNLENLAGSYKKEAISSRHLYETDSPGTIAGEGAALFLVNGLPEHALARVRALATIHSEEESVVTRQLQDFLDGHVASGDEKSSVAGAKPDLFLTGENGDNRIAHFYAGCEGILDREIPVARYKHMSGEYPTAIAFALWVACQLVGGALKLPSHMIKRGTVPAAGISPVYKNILLYNNYKGIQHSFMLISRVD